MRLRIDLAYDGSAFHGWAAQPGLRTVQGELESALGHRPAPLSRADGLRRPDRHRGPRARAGRPPRPRLVVRSPSPRPASFRRLNGVLPPDVRVRRVAVAADGFDARFSPLWRRYAYRICDGVPDPLTRDHVLAWPRALDVDAMNEASSALLGLHDFAAFCKQREGATTVRTLLDLAWVRSGDLLTGTVRADAFCHHMVRSLVGSLLAVGEGRRPVRWPAEVLSAGVRDPAVTVVPAARPDPRGGRLPAGRRAGRARRAGTNQAGRDMTAPPAEVLDAFGATGDAGASRRRQAAHLESRRHRAQAGRGRGRARLGVRGLRRLVGGRRPGAAASAGREVPGPSPAGAPTSSCPGTPRASATTRRGSGTRRRRSTRPCASCRDRRSSTPATTPGRTATGWPGRAKRRRATRETLALLTRAIDPARAGRRQ